MKNKNIFTLLVVLILFQFVSCKKSDNPSSQIFGNLISLKIGDSWTMSDTLFDENGNILNVTKETNQITKDTLIQNEQWYYFDNTWAAYKTDGLWMYLGNTPYLFFKYPVNAGDTYSLDSEYVTVIYINKTITVPEGTFNTYCYRFVKSNGEYTDEYMSAYVGYVLLEYYVKNQLGSLYLYEKKVLIGYTLN
jgi:hypothetical protein